MASAGSTTVLRGFVATPFAPRYLVTAVEGAILVTPHRIGAADGEDLRPAARDD